MKVTNVQTSILEASLKPSIIEWKLSRYTKKACVMLLRLFTLMESIVGYEVFFVQSQKDRIKSQNVNVKLFLLFRIIVSAMNKFESTK